MIHPPGTILQRMYFKERLRRIAPGRFIEVGSGEGYLSQLLLARGWNGTGYEIGDESRARATIVNREAIAAGRFDIKGQDWFEARERERVDLVISSMVLEHLDDVREKHYFERCRESLIPGGMAALFVPASPRYWGIEDEIAGHFRRYTPDRLRTVVTSSGFRIAWVAGLTWPVSNLLFPVSNYLVRRAESRNLAFTLDERTRLSGSRDVAMKTRFHPLLGLVLNETVLYPFHMLQKLGARSQHALTLYAELSPQG
jgi:SAM-dependent methyltransferase